MGEVLHDDQEREGHAAAVDRCLGEVGDHRGDGGLEGGGHPCKGTGGHKPAHPLDQVGVLVGNVSRQKEAHLRQGAEQGRDYHRLPAPEVHHRPGEEGHCQVADATGHRHSALHADLSPHHDPPQAAVLGTRPPVQPGSPLEASRLRLALAAWVAGMAVESRLWMAVVAWTAGMAVRPRLRMAMAARVAGMAARSARAGIARGAAHPAPVDCRLEVPDKLGASLGEDDHNQDPVKVAHIDPEVHGKQAPSGCASSHMA
mmetsp:Transcript_59717/g.177675  ORF Transcript_59717/g.177675 Transcript_59717/m.177675 type:complete len:258 (+) Transcript_59717:950-1723(+)